VLAAPDRDDLGLMIFPPPGRSVDAAYREELRAAIAKINEGVSGSSRTIARAIVLTEPPSLDAGEITDKGSINQRAVLRCREAAVAALYAPSPPPHVIVAQL